PDTDSVACLQATTMLDNVSLLTIGPVRHLRHHRCSLSHGWLCSAQIPVQNSRSTALKHLPQSGPAQGAQCHFPVRSILMASLCGVTKHTATACQRLGKHTWHERHALQGISLLMTLSWALARFLSMSRTQPFCLLLLERSCCLRYSCTPSCRARAMR